MKICFAAGGSGGHITPALAVADHIRLTFPETKLFFISSSQGLDADIFAQHPILYKRSCLVTAKFRRYFSFQNIVDIFRFPKSLFQAFKILKKENPDVILSKGGYVALPVGIVAKVLKIPFVIHESDAISGLSNMILRKISSKILTTFPDTGGTTVGTPVRNEIFSGNEELGRKFLGFPKNKKIILVMGGSQGAEIINQLLLHSLPVLLKEANVVHLSGKGKSAQEDSRFYKSFSYLGKEFPHVLAASTIVISRAGANSLFECAAQGKPTVLIPLSSSANDHQKKNAEFFLTRSAAYVVDEQGLTSGEFQKKILNVLSDIKLQKNLSENILHLASRDATQKIVKHLMAFERKVC